MFIALGILAGLFILVVMLFKSWQHSLYTGRKRRGFAGVILKYWDNLIYSVWGKKYIAFLERKLIPRMNRQQKEQLANRFHAKVLVKEQAGNILTFNRNIESRDLEQIIPFTTARTLVLKGPPDVAVYNCACRGIREHPCNPVQVCMLIGQPFVNFMLALHPQTSRRINQEEALELLREEHERGHIQTAWFKDTLDGRFYVICNCCKCCCFAIRSMQQHYVPLLAPSGYAARVNRELCTACGKCKPACPFAAIRSAPGKPEAEMEVDTELCMGCGVCISRCNARALSLVRDEKKGIPFDVASL